MGLYLTSDEAYKMVRAEPGSVLFLDVRSVGEVEFVGMPAEADANIAYMPQSEVGKRLAAKGLHPPTDPVILICRSGDGSAKAADLLAQLGYTKIFLSPEQMYNPEK